MARVTVEDCVLKIPDRFELVLTAAQRAREIGKGAPLTVDRDNDKNTVVSLREIADETIPLELLKDNVITSQQRLSLKDDDSEDVIEMMEGEEDWSQMSARELEDDDLLSIESGDQIGKRLIAEEEEEVAETDAELIGQAIDPSQIPEGFFDRD